MVLLFLGQEMNSKISQPTCNLIKFESQIPQIFGLQYDQIFGALPPWLNDMNTMDITTKCYKVHNNTFLENGSKIDLIQIKYRHFHSQKLLKSLCMGNSVKGWPDSNPKMEKNIQKNIGKTIKKNRNKNLNFISTFLDGPS